MSTKELASEVSNMTDTASQERKPNNGNDSSQILMNIEAIWTISVEEIPQYSFTIKEADMKTYMPL